MERLSLESSYDPVEMAIHGARYALALPFCRGRRILDLACGEGYGSALMERWGAADVTGVDIDAGTIEVCQSLFPECRFVRASAEEADAALAPANFDLIVSLETMEHVQDLDRYFESLRRLRSPGGGILITCPNDPWYNRNRSATNEFHLRELDYDAFRDTIGHAFPSSEIVFQIGTVSVGFLNSALRTAAKGAVLQEMLDELVPLQGLAVPSSEAGMPPSYETASYFVAHVDLAPPGATYAGYQLSMEALRALRGSDRQAAEAGRQRIETLERVRAEDREALRQARDAAERGRQRIEALEAARDANRVRLEETRAAHEAARDANRVRLEETRAAHEAARETDRARLQRARDAAEQGRQRIEALEAARDADRVRLENTRAALEGHMRRIRTLEAAREKDRAQLQRTRDALEQSRRRIRRLEEARARAPR